MLDGGALMVGQARSFGPAGCGKSLITFQFVAAAIRRGENVAFFAFDEEFGLVFRRTKAMGIDLEAFHKKAACSSSESMQQSFLTGRIFPSGLQNDGVSTVIIDSLNGYQQAMPEDQS